MKKIALVTLILCISVFFLTACTSLSTYMDRLATIDKSNGAYIVEDYAEGLEEMGEKYSLDMGDYAIIESIKAANDVSGENVVIIATWTEGKAEKLAGDLDSVVNDLNGGELTYKVITDGRFVLLGTEGAIADCLGK